MKCPKCGAENPEGSKFCQECGANIERTDNMANMTLGQWIAFILFVMVAVLIVLIVLDL